MYPYMVLAFPNILSAKFMVQVKLPKFVSYSSRRASNPMDKGACNSANSKIQTW